MMRKFFSGSERQVRGLKVGVVGFCGNVALFAVKMVVGVAAGSIAVIVDSLNNVLDSAGSVVTMVGFKVAGRRGDRTHPHGHGRVEYIAAFVIALIIIVTAVVLGMASVGRIFAPTAVEASVGMMVVIALTMVGKGLLAGFYLVENRKIDSQMLAASGRDALADVLVTGVTLIALCLAPVTDFPVDGVVGVGISVFILVLGGKLFFANMHLLIGRRADRGMLLRVRRVVLEKESFCRIMRVDFHDYGPEAREFLIKVRLQSGISKYKVERDIDLVQQELLSEYAAEAVIYWAPMR